MSEAEGTLTDFPEMDAADLSDAIGLEPQAEPAADDDPAADPGPVPDDEGDDPPADPANPDAELPQYRREAIANRELRAEIADLKRLIQDGQKPKVEDTILDPTAAVTPEQKIVRDKFFKLFPEAKDIFDRAKDIIRASEVAPGLASRAEQAEDARASGSINSAVNAVASKVLGAGKTAADLRPAARERTAKAFASWCGADYLDPRTGQLSDRTPKDVLARAARYDAGDQSLFDEFAKDFLSDFTPANRGERVAAAKRATVASPRGGPSSAPPPAGPKPVDPNDEDAIHKGAWKSVQAANAAG